MFQVEALSKANNCNLYIPKSRGHKNFSYLAASCWNTMPHELRYLDDIKKFSNNLKAQLLSSVTNDATYDSCNIITMTLYPPLVPAS